MLLGLLALPEISLFVFLHPFYSWAVLTAVINTTWERVNPIRRNRQSQQTLKVNKMLTSKRWGVWNSSVPLQPFPFYRTEFIMELCVGVMLTAATEQGVSSLCWCFFLRRLPRSNLVALCLRKQQLWAIVKNVHYVLRGIIALDNYVRLDDSGIF